MASMSKSYSILLPLPVSVFEWSQLQSIITVCLCIPKSPQSVTSFMSRSEVIWGKHTCASLDLAQSSHG